MSCGRDGIGGHFTEHCRESCVRNNEAREKTGFIPGRSSEAHYGWDLQQVIVMMDVEHEHEGTQAGGRGTSWEIVWERPLRTDLVWSSKDKEDTIFQKVRQEGGPSWFTGIRRQVERHKRNRSTHMVLKILVVQEKLNRNTAVELPIAELDWVIQNICCLLPLGELITHSQLLASSLLLLLAFGQLNGNRVIWFIFKNKI